MKPEHNKTRPNDRVQIDPRVVIGIGAIGIEVIGTALAAGYCPVSEATFAETETAGNWRSIHGGVPL